MGTSSSRGPEEPFLTDDFARHGVWRILDANANRAGEGLRVVEEFARFLLDDPHLTEHLKTLRHDLREALSDLPSDIRVTMRNTSGDVGTQITTPAEGVRHSSADVVAAAWKRVEQSLRCLEEYSKVVAPTVAPRLEALRYRTYVLEKALDTTRRSLERLAGARLYILLDGGESLDDFTRRASALITAGAPILQLRDKRLDDRTLLERARRLRVLTATTATLFIMNDRPDLAYLARADGVHVGQEELRVQDVRAVVGPQMLVGVSTHSLEQARAAVLDGADYIGVGPTFPSTTKEFSEFPGLELLHKVSREIRLPAFAIGGVTLERLPQVRAAGFVRVAVSAAIHQADDPAAAVQTWLARLAEQ